jgi:serine/threonine protein kinase/WD40 repeat protein
MSQSEHRQPGTCPAVAAEDPRVLRAVEEILAAQQAGRRLDRRALLARHADIAPLLARCLDGLDLIQKAAPLLHDSSSGPDSSDNPVQAAGGLLGDYRLVREVGRGGMGVVYEAEQISLRRRVALKVLPFASTLDARQLERFKNEARAAAQLHHTHIVPVFATGCERGVHYYAMQYIEGRTLAGVIVQLRALAEQARSGAAGKPPCSQEVKALLTEAWVPKSEEEASGGLTEAEAAPLPPAPATTPRAHSSTEPSLQGPAFFRMAARLGVQAAEALEHAHQLGVVHRDIKPANLLIDERGSLWVTDFGLAHCQGQAGLTLSGDLLGTLRYMSPEQALARQVPIDHRTDIYSLGVTLYELLTLEPAFGGRDRQEVLRQIAQEEPRPPRRWNPAIPAELEVIVLKAMAKEPSERYATAQELADDLERFLQDQPIRARRPTLLQRATKWVRRHQAISWVGAAALAVLALGSTISALIIAHHGNLAEQRRQDAENERRAARQAEKRANDERDRARQAEARAEAINQFLVRNMLTFKGPGQFGFRGGDTTVAEVLEEASRGVETSFPGQPQLQASIRLTIGNTYFSLGRYKEAAEHLRRGLDLQGDVLAESDDPWGQEYAETALATKRLGLALQALGQTEQAKPLLLRGGEARRRIEIRRIPFNVNAYPFSIHPLFVVISPDSRWVLAAGDDDLLRLYDMATGVEVHRFRANNLDGLAFSPDSRHVLSGGQDNTVRLLDVFTARELRRFTGHTDRAHFVTFSPDGQRALSASYDKTLRLWDVESGKEIRQFLGHTDVIHNAAFSPDGGRIVSVSRDGTIRLWDVATGAEIRSFGKKWVHLGGIAMSPDGQQALSTHEDGLRLWNVETGEEIRRIADAGTGYGPAVFTPDGRHAVSSGDIRGKWLLWDLDTGKEVRSYHLEWPLRPKGIEVSRDGRLAVCGIFRGSISIWCLGDPPAFGQELAVARRSHDQKLRDLGPDAPETLQALDELAALHLDRGEPADAEPLLRQGLERRLRLQGADHPATLAARKNLARALRGQKKWAEAVTVCRQCLYAYRRAVGPEHPDVLAAMNDLAEALEEDGQPEEADALWLRCLQGWEHLMGHEHTATRAAANLLFLKRRAHGKPVQAEATGLAAGYVWAKLGWWDRALACFAIACAKELPKDQGLLLDYACLLAHAGDTGGYQKLCSRLLERHAQIKDKDEMAILSHAVVLAPLAPSDTGPVLELAQRRNATVAPGSGHSTWATHVLALAYYRAGKCASAQECLRGSLREDLTGEHDAANWLLQALIDHRLGNQKKAREWLRKAERWIEAEAPKRDRWDDVLAERTIYWRHWLMIQLLHREAEALIRGKTPIPPAREKTTNGVHAKE